MEKEITSAVLNELGKKYVSLHNEGRQMAGSSFVLPKQKFQDLISDLGILHTDNKKPIEFLSCQVFCTQSEDDIQEIQFVENSLDIEDEAEDTERKKLLQDANSKIAEDIREILRKRKEALIDALKKMGITFSDDEAFKQFAKTQIAHESKDGKDVFSYDGKQIIEFTNNYKIN